MKREEDIFRKLKNEKPLVKTAADAPARRTPPSRPEAHPKETPSRRRIFDPSAVTAEQTAAPQRSSADPAKSSGRRIAAENAEPQTRRRIAAVPDAAQPAPKAPAQTAPRRIVSPESRPRMAVPRLDSNQSLTDKLGGNPAAFSLPAKVAKDSSERKPLTYRHE